MSDLYYESMTKIHWGVWWIRIWRKWRTDTQPGDNQDLYRMTYSIDKSAGAEEYCKTLIELDRVNAVEVLDHSGNGHIVYKDWP